MARMISLIPPPRTDIGPGPVSLVATEAGRYAKGLQFTCETWNGQCLGSALVLANNIAPYVAATATQHSLDATDVERAVLDLLVAIEGLMRRSRARPPTQGATTLPEIELTTEITAVADQAETALLQTHAAELFEHSRRLVTIAAGAKPPKGLKRPEGVPLITPVTVPRLTELASQAARFYMPTEDGRAYYRPPAWLIQTLLARTERPFSPLEAIVHVPTIRPDGSLITTEGYDDDTGLYLDLGAVQYPPIPQAPSLDNARDAMTTLKDPLCDVPFADPCHLSATLAMTLTLICRHFVLSSIPLGGITAHGQGAGKGLLATVIALIGTGRPCAFWPQPIDEAEEKKRLLAIGLQGDSVVCIDNVTKPFGSGTFANVVTSMTYADRILGVSQNAEVRFHCVWLATGNNLVYQADMSRRVLPIIIDPKVERPEERTGFMYPDLPGHVLSQRSALVTAALTIMLAYVHAGCPKQTTRAYGSFDDWYQKIAGALMWLGEPDPCDGRKALQDEVEDELLSFRQLVLCWEACYRATLSTPRTLKQVAFEIKTNADPQAPNAWDDLREALGAFDHKYDGQHLDTRPAGYALRKYRGRVIENKRFVSDPHTKAGAPWHVDVL